MRIFRAGFQLISLVGILLSTCAVAQSLPGEAAVDTLLDLNVNAPNILESFITDPQLERKQAKEVDLLTVSSDAMSGNAYLKLLINADYDLVGLRYYHDPEPVREIYLEELVKGVVLLRQSDRDVATIVTPSNFTRAGGGGVDLIYLSNGIFKEYKPYHMTLVRTPKDWVLQTMDKPPRSFRSMFLKKKVLPIIKKTIGIEEVIVN